MIKVLIVDDSATVRATLNEILSHRSEIEIIGLACDAFEAKNYIVSHKPDVICLDVEMPYMDGITFLKQLMKHYPTPTVMISTLTHQGAHTTIEALEAGAVDYIGKPQGYNSLRTIGDKIVQKILDASKARVSRLTATVAKKAPSPKQIYAHQEKPYHTHTKVIAIGASTGGVTAVKQVLSNLSNRLPGMVLVQHMPPNFVDAFAQRLDANTEISVKVAQNGDRIQSGTLLVAPGDYHLAIRMDAQGLRVEIGSGEKVSGHRPSVNVMFSSIATIKNHHALGVILTGMGKDGAIGLKEIKNSGGHTIAQDEKSSVVYGMPKEAFNTGAVKEVVPLDKIANSITQTIKNG